MKNSALSLSIALSLAVLSLGKPAFAGEQTTVRTGPNGNTQTTQRVYGDGQQTVTRTSSNGNTQTTERVYSDGQQTVTRTSPNGNTQTTTRTRFR